MNAEQERADFEAALGRGRTYTERDFEMYRLGRAALQSQYREDALRYRYLRVQDNYDFEFAVVKNPHFDVFQSPQELDEAIDHARRIEGGKS